MAARRSYDDPCGVARALDLVGERWALLVVRELVLGPKRFANLSRGLPGMSQNVLSQRLRELEQAGIVQRRMLGPPASTRAYELTQRGYALEPVLIELGRWGSREAAQSGAELSVDALVLALKTTFDPRAAAGLQARYELRLGEDRFHARVEGRVLQIARGRADQPDVTLETDAATLRGVVFGGRGIEDAIDSGRLHLEGDRKAAVCFAACFSRPSPVGRER